MVRLPRRLFTLLLAIVVSLTLTTGIAFAHSAALGGCSHADHFAQHGGHYDYYDYNGGFWADGGHYHNWYNGSHATQHYDYCAG